MLAEPAGGATHPEIAAAIRSAGDVLSNAGHDVVEATPPDYEALIDMWAALLLHDIVAMRPILDMVMGNDAKSLIADFIDQGPEITNESLVVLQSARHGAMTAWSEFFAEHPVLLSPTWAMPAFTHGLDLAESEALIRSTLRPVLPMNFLGLPAAVVPHGHADGLPVGVQVVGDRFSDLRCLSIAEQIEAATDPLLPIDPVT